MTFPTDPGLRTPPHGDPINLLTPAAGRNVWLNRRGELIASAGAAVKVTAPVKVTTLDPIDLDIHPGDDIGLVPIRFVDRRGRGS